MDSVKSPVANLCDGEHQYSFESVTRAFVAQVQEEHPQVRVREVPLQDFFLKAVPAVDEAATMLRSWDWQFAQTPPFTHTADTDFSWGYVVRFFFFFFFFFC